MVGFGTVGFALSVVVVLEFDSACWAVRDAHGLCSCEYLFSELFVFSCACSAHRVSLFCVCVGVRWWRVAASARRAPPPPNTTLCSLFLFLPPLAFLTFFVLNGGCRVVRAQLCEHARNTTRASCSGFVYCVWCVFVSTTRGVCCPHHTLFVVNDHHAHH